jgi:hypothetical protein
MTVPAESALALRQRGSWEAADSGALLWRDGFVYFIPFFALPVWVAAFALRVPPELLRPWSYLILWWMKPLFDRIVLHIIAVRFFEPRSGARRLCRGLGKVLFRGLLGDLGWRRFSPWRASRMPVRVLEGVRGKGLRRRKRLLERGGLDFCLLITILSLALEGLLFFGEAVFAWMMIELFRPDLGLDLFEIIQKFETFFYAAYCLNYILIESLYVCMGFGIYINSRIEVEGWDIQLLFQNFTRRRQSKGGEVSPLGRTPQRSWGTLRPTPATPPPGGWEPPGPPFNGRRFQTCAPPTGPALLCLALLLFAPSGAGAQAADSSGDSGEEGAAVKVLIPGPRQPLIPAEGLFPADAEGEPPLEELREILASPDFGGEREVRRLKFKEQEQEERPPPSSVYASWMETLRQVIAQALRLLLGAALAAGLGYSLYRLLRQGRRGRPPEGPAGQGWSPPPPEDPAALLDRARELHRQGRLREAWAACLAGTFAAYSRRRGLLFPRDATEYDCLGLVRASEGGEAGPERAAGFETLVRRWVAFAYAGEAPGAGDFERSLGFGRSLLSPVSGPGEEGARG